WFSFPLVAHSDASRQRRTSVAFGAKRTSQLSSRVQSWAVATSDFTRPLVERACALAKPYAVALCTRSKEQATSTQTINAGLLVNADVSSQFPMDQGFVSILASGTPLDADCWSSQQ